MRSKIVHVLIRNEKSYPRSTNVTFFASGTLCAVGCLLPWDVLYMRLLVMWNFFSLKCSVLGHFVLDLVWCDILSLGISWLDVTYSRSYFFMNTQLYCPYCTYLSHCLQYPLPVLQWLLPLIPAPQTLGDTRTSTCPSDSFPTYLT